jgi:hypothetical protein
MSVRYIFNSSFESALRKTLNEIAQCIVYEIFFLTIYKYTSQPIKASELKLVVSYELWKLIAGK